MRLYLLECKKIMTSRFHLILLLLFMMLEQGRNSGGSAS